MKLLARAFVLLAVIAFVPRAGAISADLRVGPQQNKDGSVVQSRATQEGGQASADVAARYEEMTVRGNVFNACNTAAQATSVNSPTATGLILTNPAGSGKNLVLLEASVSAASLPAGVATFVITGSTAVGNGSMAVIHTTALVIQNSLIGGPRNSVAFADSSATIPGNVIFRTLPGGPAATVASSTAWPPVLKDEIAGALVLAPGSVASIQSLTTAISAVSCFTWKEVLTAP